MNHSCRPNTIRREVSSSSSSGSGSSSGGGRGYYHYYYDRIALRSIRLGDELTRDYIEERCSSSSSNSSSSGGGGGRMAEVDGIAFDCKCGEFNCRGLIRL